MALLLAALAVFVVSFLLGSIPWGVIFSKLFFKEDVRDHGSGNIGTTNMMRTYGAKAGVAVFLLDFAKGLVSGLVATAVFALLESLGALGGAAASLPIPDDGGFRGVLLGVSFAGCVWGHIFSPWLGFKGGKGIATAVGNLFVFFGPIPALLEIAVFAVFVAATRYVSLGSVMSALACLAFSAYCWWGNPLAVAFAWAGALTVVWAHRGNIQRLANGTERKIGKKKEGPADDAGASA